MEKIWDKYQRIKIPLLSIGMPALAICGYYLIDWQQFANDLGRFQAQRSLVRVLVVLFLGLSLLPLKRTFQKVKEFTLHSTGSYNLAVIRILFFALAGGLGAPLVFIFGFEQDQPWESENLSSLPHLAYMDWFFQNIPYTPATLLFALKVTVLSAFFAMIGLFSRVAMILYTMSAFYVMGFHFYLGEVSMDHHMIWIAAILAVSPVNEKFSVDNLIRKWRKKPPIVSNKGVEFGIPIRLIWILLGTIYFFPGFWKLWDNGLDWALTDNVRNILYLHWSNLPGFIPPIRIDQNPIIYKLSGLAALFFEFGFIFLLFRRPLRNLATTGGLAYHNILYWILDFQQVKLWLSYLVFVDWNRVISAIKQKNWRLLKTQEKEASNYVINKKSNAVLIVGLFLILGNFLFGAFGITSWPISAYPTYSEMIPSREESLQIVLHKENSVNTLSQNDLEDLVGLEKATYWKLQVLKYDNSGEAEKEEYWLGKIATHWESDFKNDSTLLKIEINKIVYSYKEPSPTFQKGILEHRLLYSREFDQKVIND